MHSLYCHSEPQAKNLLPCNWRKRFKSLAHAHDRISYIQEVTQ